VCANYCMRRGVPWLSPAVQAEAKRKAEAAELEASSASIFEKLRAAAGAVHTCSSLQLHVFSSLGITYTCACTAQNIRPFLCALLI